MITLVAGTKAPEQAELEKIYALVKKQGVERIASPDWLAPDKAVDIVFDGTRPEMLQAVRQALSVVQGMDVFIQPVAGRRKKLLVADMDATIVVQETLDELAAHCGVQDQVSAITQKAMRGEIDFHDALRERVAMIKGMPLDALEKVLEGIQYSKGAQTLVSTLKRFQTPSILVSGGFDVFTSRVAMTLGFEKHVSNRLQFSPDNRLTGEIIPPIVDKETKRKVLQDAAVKIGCGAENVVAIGDGANDIPMLQIAGTGIGYFGKPAVQAATLFQIRHSDLTAVLYMQGYRQEMFAS